MKDTLRNIHTSLVPIGQVVSEEKIFEKLLTTKDDDDDNNDGRQVIAIAHMAYGQVS